MNTDKPQTLTKKELAALAMHELMKREQEIYRNRVTTQQEIALKSTEELKKLVEAI